MVSLPAILFFVAASGAPAVAPMLALPMSAAPTADVAAITRAISTMDATDVAGRRWTGDDLYGRVILIDFWATWCAPCLADMPRLKALREAHAREDFEILGISLDVRSRQSLVSWLNRQRIDWPQVHEKSGYGGTVPRLFGIESLPRTVLVGRDGRIAAVDLRGDRLASVIDTLVSQAPATGGRK
jgi:thiol-disulfide isomerase/thioredoxin